MRYVVSTDTGGTFTDAVILDESGHISIGKAPSSPENLAKGIIGAVDVAAKKMGMNAHTVLRNCAAFLNGTTVGTNALIERKGAKTGLLITKGFEDTLVIGRVKGRWIGRSEAELTNIQRSDWPKPIVPRHLTRGIIERIDYQGKVLCPLNVEDLRNRINELIEEGIEALAVSFLWSFKNPVHEEQVRDLVEEEYPQLYLTISSKLAPLIMEYERTSTTAVNSYLGKTLSRYISNLKDAVAEKDYGDEILVMQSIGGLAPASQMESISVTTLYSGPVGGVIGALKQGCNINEKNIITTDMGGTSFDVGLIVDGATQHGTSSVVERVILMVPSVAVKTVGAGGGSVAWLDEAKSLRVGPASQGAVPGPACYGLGGDLPTVTDADVVLGYINPDYFLGGAMTISKEKAEAAIKKIADPLGLSVVEAAQGIYRIVNSHMADLIRKVTIEKGYDPRNFTLFAFGGCGPVHCNAFGTEVGARKIVIPQNATTFSALGIAMSDFRHFYEKSCPASFPIATLEATDEQITMVNGTFNELLTQAEEQLLKDKVPRSRWILMRKADLRYQDQIHELTVTISEEGELDGEGLRTLCRDFMMQYERVYGPGSSSKRADISLVTLRVDGIGPVSAQYEPLKHVKSGADASAAYIGTRDVWWGREKLPLSTPIYRGEKLAPGNVVKGPAIIESYGTTVPVNLGRVLQVDEYLNLVITADAAGDDNKGKAKSV